MPDLLSVLSILLARRSGYTLCHSGSELRRKAQRYSPDRLLRRKVVLPDGSTVSAEKHRDRLLVRIEVPDGEK